MLNKLFARGANVIYGNLATVHVSGHGSRDESAVAEFAVLAPGTDSTQAVRLAERLAEGLRAAGVGSVEKGVRTARLMGGYDSVTDAGETPVRGPELITRATAALARAKVERNGEWLKPFRPSLPNGLSLPQ